MPALSRHPPCKMYERIYFERWTADSAALRRGLSGVTSWVCRTICESPGNLSGVEARRGHATLSAQTREDAMKVDAKKYGPWAVIPGGSEGIGTCLATML